MKFLIDAYQLKQLIDRKDDVLGQAIADDIEVTKSISLSPETRHLIVIAFEMGYAAALSNVTKLLEAPSHQPSVEEKF